MSTPGHDFVAQDYDPSTDRCEVGHTGTLFRGGSEWMTLAEIERLGKGPVYGVGDAEG